MERSTGPLAGLSFPVPQRKKNSICKTRHPKWLNIIYFFYVKMYRVLLKVLARKGGGKK